MIIIKLCFSFLNIYIYKTSYHSHYYYYTMCVNNDISCKYIRFENFFRKSLYLFSEPMKSELGSEFFHLPTHPYWILYFRLIASNVNDVLPLILNKAITHRKDNSDIFRMTFMDRYFYIFLSQCL